MTKQQVVKKRCNNCAFGRQLDTTKMKEFMNQGGVKPSTTAELVGLYRMDSVKCVKKNLRVPHDDWCNQHQDRPEGGVTVWPQTYDDVKNTFPSMMD